MTSASHRALDIPHCIHLCVIYGFYTIHICAFFNVELVGAGCDKEGMRAAGVGFGV